MNAARHATIMLLLTTFFWGLSFPLVKVWLGPDSDRSPDELLTALTLIALRMLPALLVLLLWKPHLLRRVTRQELATGALIGLVFFVGFVMQVWALGRRTVTPTMSAFLTGLCSVWAPLLGWFLLGVRPLPATLVGLTFAVAGAVVLGFEPGEDATLNAGMVATVAASLLFGVQILLLDRLGRKVRSEYLTVSFFGITGLLALLLALLLAGTTTGVGPWAREVVQWHRRREALIAIVLLILLPTVLSFHWMNAYQPRVTAARAALIYLLEPVFTALVSVSFGRETLTDRLLLGGLFILIGNAFVEILGKRRLT
jgi:drug/metabolite transporter (DMT)-like permease